MTAFTGYVYRGAPDLLEMAALVRWYPEHHLHVVDLPYRLASWAFDHAENAHLWRDQDGRLAGWAVLQTPFWTVDIACRPDCLGQLYPAILTWADAAARHLLDTPFGRPAWFVNVYPHQAAYIAALAAAGWACQADVGEESWSQVLLARQSSSPLPQASLPSGYTLRLLAGESEIDSYITLHQAVFDPKNMTVAWRRRTLLQPEYRPDLDLVVATPTGELAAFCIGWLSPDRRLAQVEPIGVASEHRRLGLGAALLAACLERMHTFGAQLVYVLTDNNRGPALELYESLGFRAQELVQVYRRDIGG